jgi:hypothetical protein
MDFVVQRKAQRMIARKYGGSLRLFDPPVGGEPTRGVGHIEDVLALRRRHRNAVQPERQPEKRRPWPHGRRSARNTTIFPTETHAAGAANVPDRNQTRRRVVANGGDCRDSARHWDSNQARRAGKAVSDEETNFIADGLLSVDYKHCNISYCFIKRFPAFPQSPHFVRAPG